jgi:hypothetical protein
MTQAKAENFTDVCRDLTNQPGKTWRKLNTLIVRKNILPVNSLGCGDKLMTNRIEIVNNEFMQYFRNLPHHLLYQTTLAISLHLSIIFFVFHHYGGSSSWKAIDLRYEEGL